MAAIGADEEHTMRNSLMGWIAPAVLAAGLGFGAIAPVHAQDSLSQVLVNVADVVFNNGTPYDRYGNYGSNDRLTTGRDAYGRTVYYRQDPYNGNPYNQRAAYDRYGRPAYDQYGRRVDYSRDYRAQQHYRNGAPYGNAYGYYGNGNNEHCNKHGKCKHHGDRHNDGNDDHGWNDQGRNDRGDNGDDDND
jgi:hypothetical protein